MRKAMILLSFLIYAQCSFAFNIFWLLGEAWNGDNLDTYQKSDSREPRDPPSLFDVAVIALGAAYIIVTEGGFELDTHKLDFEISSELAAD